MNAEACSSSRARIADGRDTNDLGPSSLRLMIVLIFLVRRILLPNDRPEREEAGLEFPEAGFLVAGTGKADSPRGEEEQEKSKENKLNLDDIPVSPLR